MLSDDGIAESKVTLPAGISESDARDELDRVLASEAFHTSDRNRRFLAYVVNETLCGRGDRIKAYNVATSVFGRGADFDPQSDTIVRIEAGRLRRALEHFYLTTPERGRVRISIPTGTYVPSFTSPAMDSSDEAPPTDAKRTPAGRWRGPRVFVADFEQESDASRLPDLGRRFSQQVIKGLAQFDGIFVYGVHTAGRHSENTDISPLAEELDVDFVLTGSISATPERFEAEMLLQRVRDRRYVWAKEFRREVTVSNFMAVREEIAASIARLLGQRYGVIFSHARDNIGHPPTDFDHYTAVLDFYDYWRSFDAAHYEPVRATLEKVVVEDPSFAEAFACLSLVYTNAVRYGYDVSSQTPDPLGRAAELAEEAIRLAPASSKAFYAQALARWFSHDLNGAMSSLAIAHDLNPNDDEILADLGLRHAVRMHWDEALPLLEQAYDRNPYQSSTYRIALFLFHFMNRRYREALKEAESVKAPMVAHPHLAVATANAELGNLDEARRALDRLEEVSPGYLRDMEADLAIRNVHPDIVKALRSAVDKVCTAPVAAAAADVRTISGRTPMRAPSTG